MGVRMSVSFLHSIGAHEVIEIDTLLDESSRPLLKERWHACVDSLGGNILTSAIRSLRANGAVTCCGNAVSQDLALTVYPFILRGVTLFGIDSQNCPMPLRVRAWQLLANEWKFPWLETLAREVQLKDVPTELSRIKKMEKIAVESSLIYSSDRYLTSL